MFKKILKFRIFKLFYSRYPKLFNSFYKQKLNNNLIDLIKKEVEIETVYDIGAYRGEFSNFLSNTSLKDKDFYLFEANEKNKKYLNKFDFKYFIVVLSNNIKQVKFYSKSLTGDSYFLEKTDFYDDSDAKNLTTDTLDNTVKTNNLPLPDFVKIDTQGSELDILKGSKYTISNCKLIYLECPIIEYNEGSPNLNEYIEYLNSIDFIPYDICEVHHMDEVLVQIDILFIKKSILNKIYPGKKILNILN